MDIENVAKTQLDTRLAKAKPIKLGWSSDETDRIASALNELLANFQVHYQKLRNYHWNVKGQDFFDLHEQFELLYTEVALHIDEIAERIRVFSHTPLSTMHDYLEHSAIKETGSDLQAEVMVREVLSDFRILLGYLVNVLSIASEQEDAGTEQMIKGYIKKIEKHHWMLTAFLAK
ncbi:Dps family protein [Ohtaekwangia sp.]|uniref:Dps family protein n=1 Tax=Ohtaekwangia sp. TaxID=2066019 RepID=UPI002F9292F2